MLSIIQFIKLILVNTRLVVPKVLRNDNTRYVDNDQTSLVNFGPVALFIEAKLVTSLGKHLEKVDNLHTVCLMN